MSPPATRRVKFDFTPDELVDVSLRIVRATHTGIDARRKYRRTTAFAGGGGLTAAGLLALGISSASVVAMAAFGLVLGSVCFALAGSVYDNRQERWLRRAIDEHLTTSTDRTCEIELRPDGLSVQQAGAEMTFFWRHLSAIVEKTGDVEFHFTPGLVVARARAFGSEAERRGFIVTAHELAAAAGATVSEAAA